MGVQGRGVRQEIWTAEGPSRVMFYDVILVRSGYDFNLG